MKCAICGQQRPAYKDIDGKYINVVVLDGVSYGYCSRCMRKDLLARLNAKLHPITQENVNSKEIIEFAENELRNDKRFEALI